ncbi:MAG: hypothetical protein GXX01_07065 [Clostridiales bacterium]|nr:hypothetical protein [Clostridiales bacterium]
MKKLVTFILVLCLVLGMGTVAFADEIEYKDHSEVVIIKNFTKNGDIPNTEFTFTIGKGRGERDGEIIDAPDLTSSLIITVKGEEEKGTGTIALPKVDEDGFSGVGVYTYEITEENSNIAGVTYDGKRILKIYVFNNEDGEGYIRVPVLLNADEKEKSEGFENSFNTGTLTIYKEVTGNMGDKQRKFDITVTLTAPEGRKVTAPIYVGGGTNNPHTFGEDGELEIELNLAHGEDITISNIPYGVTYEVTETLPEDLLDYKGPVIDYSDENKVIDELDEGEESDRVIVTNQKDISIETGINLDNAPYIAILAVAIGGLALFLIRRRMAVNL